MENGGAAPLISNTPTRFGEWSTPRSDPLNDEGTSPLDP